MGSPCENNCAWPASAGTIGRPPGGHSSLKAAAESTWGRRADLATTDDHVSQYSAQSNRSSECLKRLPDEKFRLAGEKLTVWESTSR